MLDKYESITAGGDSTLPNPLMWTEVTRSDQAWQDRKEDMFSHIKPLHECENEAMRDFKEWQDERDEQLREAIELSAQEW
jgi:hypothetical protein